ncbi:MAG: carboxymuconolactone decarboxylase family protein [Alphaproteobacteria bacterium]
MTDWPDPRLTPPDPKRYSERQQEVHEAIASGPRGGVRGPLAIWLHRPELAAAAQALGRYCRYDTLLEPRLSELAILVTARVFGSEYEWHAHKPIALKAGLSEAVVEAIRAGKTPPFERRDEALVHAFAEAAHRGRNVSEALYDEAVAMLGAEAVVDLVGLLGYYTLISLTINIFGVSPPAGCARELSGEDR